jgi:hypothetical protein
MEIRKTPHFATIHVVWENPEQSKKTIFLAVKMVIKSDSTFIALSKETSRHLKKEMFAIKFIANVIVTIQGVLHLANILSRNLFTETNKYKYYIDNHHELLCSLHLRLYFSSENSPGV